jgi:hypothetical protein
MELQLLHSSLVQPESTKGTPPSSCPIHLFFRLPTVASQELRRPCQTVHTPATQDPSAYEVRFCFIR